MPEVRPVTLFAGPSAHGLTPSLIRPVEIDLRPPVRRGDIDALVDAGPPGVAVLCDGQFQSTPAVSHAEICRALDAGWEVWGVSSMGAIRAHELRREGMRGFGWVYEQFTRFEDFTDDELCLMHLSTEPFEPITEALVNVRYALERQGIALGIAPRSQQRLLAELRRLWFGDRTHETIFGLMVDQVGIDRLAADRLMTWMGQHRVKEIDLKAMLQQRPWRG